MKPSVTVYGNGDDALLFWTTAEKIPFCLGFAIERQWILCAAQPSNNGQTITLVNRVGFKDDNPQPNETRLSSQWPFQRYSWTDHEVNTGDEVRYRVTPVIRQPDGALAMDTGSASAWTPKLKLTLERGNGFSCYFNRGLVMSQFMSRYLKRKYGVINDKTLQKFKAEVKDAENPLRRFLSGDLGKRLADLLDEANSNGGHVFAALYELTDDNLINKLKTLKGRAHLVLSNGSDRSGDGNSEARAALIAAGVDVEPTNRLLRSKGLGHNKFMVITDAKQKPKAVWTGSTNWATTGLCTQINNGLLIENAGAAQKYRDQWTALRAAGSDFPPALVDGNSVPRSITVSGKKVDIWFSRTRHGEDRKALDEAINGAQQGILFLMFMPGKTGVDQTVRQKLAASPALYVKGVISTSNAEGTEGSASLIDNGKPVDRLAIIQPDGVHRSFGQWIEEVTRSMFLSNPMHGVKGIGHAIVHSKMMVIDPFGDNPVVVTGSHNFSKPASEKNDENFAIVRGHAKLAEAVAVHILAIYQHYRWRAYLRDHANPWSGLSRSDTWQERKLSHTTIKELTFWMGASS